MRLRLEKRKLTRAPALAAMLTLAAFFAALSGAVAPQAQAGPWPVTEQSQSVSVAPPDAPKVAAEPGRRHEPDGPGAKPAAQSTSARAAAKMPAVPALAQAKKLPAAPAPILPLSPRQERAPEIRTAPDDPAQGSPAEDTDRLRPPVLAPSERLSPPTDAPGETPAAAPDPAPALSPAPEQAAEPPLAPINAAVKAALEARAREDQARPAAAERRKEHEAVAAFYAARDFAPLWSRDGAANPQVESALQRLARASEDALTIKNLPVPFAANGSDEEIAAFDIALSDAVVAYGRQATGSRVDPRAISPLIGARPEVADPSVILAKVSTAGAGAGAVLKNFNPPQKAYEALRQKLAELRSARAPIARGAAIPNGPTLKVGMRDPRVPLIRAKLSLDGALSWGRDDDSSDKDLVYDRRVAAAIADFQRANGLPRSGQLTARTVALLSGGEPAQFEAEIIANMERWRWMPRDLGDSRIEVNIPDFEVAVIDNGEVVLRNRVVVGKEETPTPVFSNKMQFLIVNPYWNVPRSIVRKEMMPKLAADPHYLHRLGYETIWRGGQLTVRQPPGERNALGKIKFMFPNDYAVYLHDTPARSLFSSEKRAFSHGCVRVDDPFLFAQAVLGKGWSEQRIKKLIGGKERYVNLARPLPIYLEYFTAEIDAFGRLRVRDDIYGYSHKVKAALGLEG
jgi:murein L,D-transpeptidase YcbB/YkuD